MRTYYSIFKTDFFSGKTILVCGGAHDNPHDCDTHWQAYMYGWMDAAFELLGHGNFEMMCGNHGKSFIISVKGKVNVEYFMLLDFEAEEMLKEIYKTS